MQALIIHKENTQRNFNLSLRVGNMPVAEIYLNGQELKISKFKTSAVFPIPIVLGNGLAFAEKIIKGDDYIFNPSQPIRRILTLPVWNAVGIKLNRRKIIMKWLACW